MSPRSAVPRHPTEPKGFREQVEDAVPGDIRSTVCSQAPRQQGRTDTALTTHSTPGQQAWCSDPWRMCCNVLASVVLSHLSSTAADLSGVSIFFPDTPRSYPHSQEAAFAGLPRASCLA